MTGRHATDHRHGGRVKNPRVVVVVALLIVLAWLGIGGLGGQSVGKLSQVQKNDSSEFLPLSAESRQVQQTAKEFTGSQALPLIVVATAEDGSTLTPTHWPPWAASPPTCRGWPSRAAPPPSPTTSPPPRCR